MKKNGNGYSGYVPLDAAFIPVGQQAKHLFLLLVILASNNENHECWPKQEYLATATGCSIRSIKNAIKELKTAELIAVRKDGKKNIYLTRS